MKNQDFFPIVEDPDTVNRHLRRLCSYKIYYPICSLFIDISQGTKNNYNRVSVILYMLIYNIYI